MSKLLLILFSILTFLYSDVLTGLDVLQNNKFKSIQNKNIGLVINHTSLNKDKVHILDLLLEYEDIYVKSIFTPEHGLKGNFSAGEKIDDGFNENLGIKIISLYGNKNKPDLDDIKGLDCIVFDIQDIGSRYYTYVSTLTHMLNIASISNIPIIVLDRPKH